MLSVSAQENRRALNHGNKLESRNYLPELLYTVPGIALSPATSCHTTSSCLVFLPVLFAGFADELRLERVGCRRLLDVLEARGQCLDAIDREEKSRSAEHQESEHRMADVKGKDATPLRR
jgi:hypothetical protein